MTAHRHLSRFALCISSALIFACGNAEGSNNSLSSAGDGFGSVNLSVAPGAGAQGLMPGSGATDVADGWTVEYEKLLVTIGDVTVTYDGVDEHVTTGHVLDLRRIPERGALIQYIGAAPVSCGPLQFSMVTASESDMLYEVDTDDHARMRKNGWSIYVEGVMTNPSGLSCNPRDPAACTPAPTIRFKWGMTAPTRFGGCSGFSVDEYVGIDVVLPIPVDRWFFTSFAREAEDLPRRAQWIADADMDGNGETTMDELRAIQAADLFRRELGYDLGAAPITVRTAEDFVVAHAHTLGISGATGCRTAEPL